MLNQGLQAIVRLLTVHGLPKALKMDRDSRFVGSWTADSYPSALVRFLRVLGVEPLICPPRQPWKKAYVERTIKTLKEEWLQKHSPDNLADALDVLDGFKHYYNSDRPHFGDACNGLTPDDAFPLLPLLPRLPEAVDPASWVTAYHGKVYRRRVTSNGSIQIDKHNYHIDAERHGQRILVHVDAEHHQFVFSHNGEVILSKPMKGIRNNEMTFEDYVILMTEEARSIEMHRRAMWMQRRSDLE
ncbi:MAG: integrase core domain-containing protein [Pseudomonadota bacterium]